MNCSIILFNPGASAITVTWTTSGGSGTVSVPSRSTTIYTMPQNTGARFQSTGNPFYAIAAIDINGTVHNWGFTLIPRTSLTTSVVAGWSPGTTNKARDASPLWVTPDAPVTIYVDYDGDPATGPNTDPLGNHYNVSYSLTALQSLRIFSPGPSPYFDHTGYRIYNTSNVKLAVVWGQDGANSSSGQVTELDLGTTLIPYPTITAYKSADLIGDFNQDGGIDPGEVLLYTIRVHNSGIVPIDYINVMDTLDAQVTYVADSTTMNGAAIPDGPGNSFPLIPPAGYDLTIPGGSLDPGDPDIIITFQVTVNSPFTGTQINNQVKVTSVAEIFLNALVSVAATGTLATTKTSNLPTPPGHFLPGDTVNYTVTVQNNSAVNQTGIKLDDPLPTGTTYIAQSTQATGWRTKVVRDDFNKLLFSNNDGPENWAGDWTESDGTPANPTAGNVIVNNGELRLQATTASWARRIVNLSEFTGESATLSFTWRTNPAVDAADQALVQVSPNGSAWTTLGTITGMTGAQSGSLSYSISNYISATTYIQFTTSTGYGAGEYFAVDNVMVQASWGATVKAATDNFASGNYTGGSGWTGNWTEVDARGGGAGGGNVSINTQRLRIENRGTTNQSAQRTVDLSIPQGRQTTATLQFDFWTEAVYGSGETADVSISSDGGTSWTVLDTFTSNTTQTTKNYNILNWISANTTLRFRTLAIGSANGHYFYFDNVAISETKSRSITKDNIPTGVNPDLASGIPSLLVQQQDGFALAPGETLTVTYSVRVNQPATIVRAVNTATATSWEKAPPASASRIDPVQPGGAIGDLVWLDISGDGVPQVGEPGLANVRVWLDTNNNGVYDAGTDQQFYTDANGRYTFAALRPGTYRVFVDETTLPPGLVRDAGISNPSGIITVTTAGDEQFFDVDFGYISAEATAIIGDCVWSDFNNNGMHDTGEVGLPGVHMSLATGPGPDLTWGTPDDDITSTMTTDANGEYFFTGVAPGSYRVLAGTGPDGVLGTADDELGTHTPTVGPQSQGSRVSTDIAADAADNINYIDFGFRNASDNYLTERFWLDMDNDGVLDPGEPGMDGVTVNIFNSLGVMIGSGTTDANGSVLFAGLADGTYTVRVEDAYGRLQGFGATTPAATVGQATIVISGAPVSATDFGYNAPGVIGDLIWSDTNSNGSRDAGEAGIAGINVYLYADTNGNGIFDPGTDLQVATTQSDGSGYYHFDVTQPGRYFVSVPSQSGLTGATLTTVDDEAAAGAQREVELFTLNTSFLTADFGYKFADRHSISGSVFNDLDANGTLDGGEPMVAGVTVDLIRPGADGIFGTTDDDVAATAVTDGSGNYSFPDLPNGNYRIRVTDTAQILSGYQVTTGADYQDVTLLDADISSVLFGYYRPKPTRVLLERFSTYTVGALTVVEWETASEFGTAGFDVYRLEANGSTVKVNPAFLPGLLVAPLGGTYTLIDRGAPRSGPVSYYLVEREARGGQNTFGPFASTPGPLHGAIKPKQDYTRRAHERPAPALKMEMVRDLDRADGTIGGIRIEVSEDGFHHLDVSALADLLGSRWVQVQRMITLNQVAFSCGGQPVPYLPAEPSGLWFYGRALQNNYTDRNVYLLTFDQGRWMKVRTARQAKAVKEIQGFTDTIHTEQQVYALRTLFTDPASDFWAWDYLVADDPMDGAREFQIVTPDPEVSAADASLSIRLIGYSDLPGVTDYHIRVYWNGFLCGEASWDGTAPHIATVSVPQERLKAGPNQVRVEGLLDPGVEYSIFFLDAFELSYRRLYRAHDNRLALRGDGNETVTVSGFTEPDIQLFDVTDPGAPVFLTGLTVEGAPGDYRVSFVPATPETPYEVFASAGASVPMGMDPILQSPLTSTGNAADYVIVTTAELKEAAERLADYRRGRGLRVTTVDIQEVYDTFGHGLATPDAIRNFMSFTQSHWRIPPRYLLLAGDGTYDSNNYEGYGDCLLPPFLVGTPDGIFASDRPFGDTAGDGVPEVAVGRIPATTPEELDEYRQKIEAYEATPPDSWNSSVILLADNPDVSGNFTADSQAIAGLLPDGYSAVEIYLASLGTAASRRLLFDSLDDGAVLLNYVGHGGPLQLADEYLLTPADIATLDNAPRLPLLAAFTCSAGMFEMPGFRVLGESALLRGDGGFVAVWSPTGLSQNAQARILDQALVRALTIDGRRPLGTALLQAQKEFVDQAGWLYILDIYNLLGDPALEIK